MEMGDRDAKGLGKEHQKNSISIYEANREELSPASRIKRSFG
jgi:hypothetical protein